MQNFKDDKASKNFILGSLPITEYEWLRLRLKEVELQQSEILYQARQRIPAVYFPTTCLLSWTNSTEMGEIVEVGITGSEGLAGVILLLDEHISPWQSEVQMKENFSFSPPSGLYFHYIRTYAVTLIVGCVATHRTPPLGYNNRSETTSVRVCLCLFLAN